MSKLRLKMRESPPKIQRNEIEKCCVRVIHRGRGYQSSVYLVEKSGVRAAVKDFAQVENKVFRSFYSPRRSTAKSFLEIYWDAVYCVDRSYRRLDKPLAGVTPMIEHECADDDLPWGEARWEDFLTRSELRANKYSELLETLMDHPRRDPLIAQEMGWTARLDGTHIECDLDPSEDDEDPVDLDAVYEGEIAEDDLRAAAEYSRARRAALQALPSYRAACDFGLDLHRALLPFAEKLHEENRDPRSANAALMTAFCESLVIGAKLAGAHGMGYDDQTLCGSIVICRRALGAAQNCRAALTELSAHDDTLPRAELHIFLARNEDVTERIEDHIATLRQRVWWE